MSDLIFIDYPFHILRCSFCYGVPGQLGRAEYLHYGDLCKHYRKKHKNVTYHYRCRACSQTFLNMKAMKKHCWLNHPDLPSDMSLKPSASDNVPPDRSCVPALPTSPCTLRMTSTPKHTSYPSSSHIPFPSITASIVDPLPPRSPTNSHSPDGTVVYNLSLSLRESLHIIESLILQHDSATASLPLHSVPASKIDDELLEDVLGLLNEARCLLTPGSSGAIAPAADSPVQQMESLLLPALAPERGVGADIQNEDFLMHQLGPVPAYPLPLTDGCDSVAPTCVRSPPGSAQDNFPDQRTAVLDSACAADSCPSSIIMVRPDTKIATTVSATASSSRPATTLRRKGRLIRQVRMGSTISSGVPPLADQPIPSHVSVTASRPKRENVRNKKTYPSQVSVCAASRSKRENVRSDETNPLQVTVCAASRPKRDNDRRVKSNPSQVSVCAVSRPKRKNARNARMNPVVEVVVPDSPVARPLALTSPGIVPSQHCIAAPERPNALLHTAGTVESARPRTGRRGLMPNTQQTEWINKLHGAALWDDFVRIVSNFTDTLKPAPRTTCTGPRKGRKGFHTLPKPRKNPLRVPDTGYDPIAASKIQKEFRSHMGKAMRGILGGESPFCNISKDAITDHFSDVYAGIAKLPDQPVRNYGVLFPDHDEALLVDILPAEVAGRMSYVSNTAPGEDGIRYSTLRAADPGGFVLAAIFQRCFTEQRIPVSWKQGNVVLIHKAGERDNIKNWRPLTLSATIAKLYTGILAKRLGAWASLHGRLSSVQKGFRANEGCLEHNFVLQTIIDDCRRNKKNLCVALLDLENAFGAMPHDFIGHTLLEMGVPGRIRNIVHDLYIDAHNTIRTNQGWTDPILVKSGVKQGCPLSPILFNLALETIIRGALVQNNTGYFCFDREVQILTYADDIALIARGPTELQTLLNAVSQQATLAGLRFKPQKCISMDLACKQQISCIQKVFYVQGHSLKPLQDGEMTTYLGKLVGFRGDGTPIATLEEISGGVDRIGNSLLAPWQKLTAIRTFLMPKIDYVLRHCTVPKKSTKALDGKLRREVKKWLNLPRHASPELVFMNTDQGGAGIPQISDMTDLLLITHAFRLLSSPDETTQTLAHASLHSVVRRKLARQPTVDDVCNYLSGMLGGDFERAYGDISTLWSRVRSATRRAQKTIRPRWFHTDIHGVNELWLAIDSCDLAIAPSARRSTLKILRRALSDFHLYRLSLKPAQGRMAQCFASCGTSNHFLREGFYMRFCDWRFVHRARLDCLWLNGTKRFGQGNRSCRKCNYPHETAPHVLNHCTVHSAAWQRRHNEVQNRLAQAATSCGARVVVNSTFEGTNLRPDLIIYDDNRKTAAIVDVSIPYENSTDAFSAARRGKVEKYSPLISLLQAKGYDATVDAFLVGSLGSWDPVNEDVIRRLRLPKKYTRSMRKIMVSRTIAWSRDIYIEHVTGTRQYH